MKMKRPSRRYFPLPSRPFFSIMIKDFMHISWLGHSAFKIETKTPLRDEVVVLLNPYNFPRADLPRNLKSDLALLSQGEENTITLSGDPFIIKSPGEFEVKGVMIYVLETPGTKKAGLIFHFETESISLVFLNGFKGEMDEEMIDRLGAVDILLLPCGNNETLSAEAAANLVKQLEPRLVIPHSFNPPGRKDPFEPIDKFAKLLGQKEKEWLPKLKISKKDLPQEETRLILLEKI